tara:strand:+ start:66 stop:269 length:204 start_codon:yes stop_codon:yes gene_type:complete
MILTLTQSHVMRPRVVRIRAKKEEEKKDINPIKKFIMKVFKVEEIDYDKFRKENKWAIRPNQDKAKK